MNRAIEAVSTEELYNVISGAASQNPAAVIASTNRLKEMLGMYGTFDGLNVIATQRNVPLSVRQQSIIQFKNAALTHWRMKRLLSDEQKIHIRSRSLTLLDEEDDVIADCNKVIISKIARQDFPSQWSNLISVLISSINDNIRAIIASSGLDARANLVLRRSLDVLNAVLKELASVKMPAGIRVMGKLVEELHQTLQSHYVTLMSYFTAIENAAAITTSSAADLIRLSHIAYKCLCKMALWAWHRLTLKDFEQLRPWVNSFFESSATQLKALTELRMKLCLAVGIPQKQQPTDNNTTYLIDYLTRHIRQFGKFFRRLQQLSIAKFVELNACRDLVLYYWSKVVQATNSEPDFIADSQWAVFPVRFIVQAMAIFKESVGQWSPTKKGATGESTLSKEFVEGAVKILITTFIPLKVKDLDAWVADPEEWVNIEDKENDQWEYEIRPCAERVLMTLTIQYEGYVVPLLDNTFKTIVGLPTVDLDGIVQKEALYCAIGRCANRLRNVIPFQQWVSQYLSKEARDTNPNFPIIKRRIAWVLGKWILEDCAMPTREVWEILVHLLGDQGPGTDAVVRFTAATALRQCVDSLHFDEEVFFPYMANVIAQLLNLTAEADSLETKRRVTESLNIVIERMGSRVVPYMEMVVKPIPVLWESAGDNYLYKSALVDTVMKLIESSKEASVSLNIVTVPLIRECLSGEAQKHLDEDGLHLWKAALQNAMSLNAYNGAPTLLDLFPIAIELLSENLDLLGTVTSVIQSYLVLDAPRVLQAHAIPLFQAFAKAMRQAIQSNQKDLLVDLQILVQLAPAHQWGEPMHISGLFAALMKTIMEDKADTILLTEHICLLARMAINDSVVVSQLIAATAASTSRPESELWNALMDQWWRRFDNMSEPRYSKLAAMGVACLVALGRPEVLERLNGEIFNLWLDVFGEMKEALVKISELEEESQQSTLSPLVAFWRGSGTELPSSLDDIKGTPEYKRWVEIYKLDPVEREKLTSFVSLRLQQATQACGGVQALEAVYLCNADPDVLKQLKQELAL